MEREVSEVPKMYICDVCGEPTPNATLTICDESMERLLSRLRGEGDAD